MNSQGAQFILADMAIAVQAARLMVYEAAELIDEGKVSTLQSSLCKCLATDTATRVADLAIELLGPEGITRDHPAEMFLRDAKLLQIVEGTNQIQRLIISRIILS
jgi:alkylation response protein AidB-like acyl-CoA dehydrogenase